MRIQDARDSVDGLERLMAFALEWLQLPVSAAAAVFCPVDRRLNVFTTGPIVTRVDPRRPVALEQLRAEYVRAYRTLDPFAPRRWSASALNVVSARDIGGAEALHDSPYGALLTRCGVSIPTLLFLRDEGRIVASIALLRGRGEPEISSAEIALLRRCQPLLEQAYSVARPRPSRLARSAGLRSGRLTPRELEIAHLVAAGATNGEIALALSVSVATVKTHMTHVLAKLALRSRTELAMQFRDGLHG